MAEYIKVYDRICRGLIQYTSVNNANIFTISNSPDKGKIGIKKAGEVIVVLGLYGNIYKMIPPSVLAEKKQKYPHLKVFSYTDGDSFMAHKYSTARTGKYGFDAMMSLLIDLVKEPLTVQPVATLAKPIAPKVTYKDVFANIFELFQYLHDQWGTVGLNHPVPFFEVMELSENRAVACPMPMLPLYRGESRLHEPCKASLFRKKWTNWELLERDIQLADFKQMLEVHPEVKDLKKGGLYVNYIGMGQHYGIPTGVLDLTNSPLVAAFFATTTYDSLSDTYRPIMHSESQGVIYFFQNGGLFNDFVDEPKILPIGMEALRRPGEQHGYGMETDEDDDLNKSRLGKRFRFWHSQQASLKIWELCGGGNALFPYDPMAEKVRVMRKYRIYSEQGLEEAYQQHPDLGVTPKEAREHLEKSGCQFVASLPFAYTEQEIRYIEEEHRRMYPGNYE